MAETAEGNALTAQNRSAQLALRAAVIRDVTSLWPLWTPGRVAEYGRFTDVAMTLIAARHQDSAGLGAAYYRAFRAVEGARGPDTPRMPPRLTARDMLPALRVTGLSGVMRALRAGFSVQAASRSGLVQVAGAAGRLVLSGGRDVVLASVGADGAAAGWRRIASGGACEFCAMLAGRGPVYKGERTADFQAHDHCACSAEPVFERAPAPSGGGLSGGGGRAGAGQGGAGGAGGPGGRPPAPPAGAGGEGDEPRPVLPRGPVTPGLPGRADVAGSEPRRPSFDEVARRAAATWDDFTDAERRVAEWLHARGVVVEAVRKTQDKSPDAIIRAAGATVEFKTLTSARQFEQRFHDAKQQAGHIVMDITATGLGEPQARLELARILRNHGRGVEEVVVVGRGFVLSWP